LVFYAGIAEQGGQLVTSGGRVAAVTSYGDSIADAVEHSLNAIAHIKYENMYFRRDIGYEFKV
jgi:phosphoribosylamine--glycine ligase